MTRAKRETMTLSLPLCIAGNIVDSYAIGIANAV